MKSLIARRGSDQPAVVELAAPQQVDGGDVRVAVAAAAFTYFDAFVPAHQEALGLPEQVGLGFDFSGTVTEVGPDVIGFAVGDRVAGLHVDITAPVRAHTEELVIGARRARSRSRRAWPRRCRRGPADARWRHARRSTYSDPTTGACW